MGPCESDGVALCRYSAVAFTRSVKQWNSLGSGGEGQVSVTILRQERCFRSSSESSFPGTVGVFGQFLGESHRKEGPLVHLLSPASSSRVFPLVMSSAGLFKEST